MKRSEGMLMVLQVPLDYTLILLAAVTAYGIRFLPFFVHLRTVRFDLTLPEFFTRAAIAGLGIILIFALDGLYSPDPNRKLADVLKRIVVMSTVSLAFVALSIIFLSAQFESRFLLVATWFFTIVFVGSGRILMRAIRGLMYRLGLGLRNVIIVGDEHVGDRIGEELTRRQELGYHVLTISKNFTESDARKFDKRGIDEIIFAHPRGREAEALKIIEYCTRHHIVFKYSADMFAAYSANATITALAGMPIVELKRTPLEGWGKVLKRVSDIVFSLLLIVLCSPILLIIAFVVFIETGRPILYKNERVGYRGNTFFTYKFRSMYQKDSTGPQFGRAGKFAEKREKQLIEKQNTRTGPIYKIGNDPRITPVGRFLRKWSLDELPQFFNVLVGTMSMVGPRPHQPREVDLYRDAYPTVFAVKPGITGLSQISGRSDLEFEEEMRLDVLYIERWTLFLDVIIILKTPFILFKKRKAE
ncbi:MAG TPA: sugar transferase [Candidatus Magasanikbacteria bacterium]|nr:sugar transferase [Candidatus Magasanikbacteria bacterium]